MRSNLAGILGNLFSIGKGSNRIDLRSNGGSFEYRNNGGSYEQVPGVNSAYMVLDSSGNLAVTDTESTMNLDSESVSHANYSLSADEITVNAAGTYLIAFSFCYDLIDTLGSTRCTIEVHVEDDKSGSYADTPGSFARGYIREATGGCGCSATFVRELNSGDKVRLRAQRLYASTNVDTPANKVSLTMVKVA